MDEAVALLQRALDDNPPFPWQVRLLRVLLDGATPTALDLPTGLGKTSVMAIWLVARALGASGLPRRLVYVVDRRAVVDQATREAERLRAWADDHRESLGLDGPLPVSTLRGQFVDNRDWLADPTVPAIVVGTVDMVGSRMLFEGYGVSRWMRPFFAGYLGTDVLLVLDEAHLVPPFEHLAAAATTAGPLRPDRGLPPPALLSLSATGRSDRGAPFRLDADDHAHPVVCARIHAPKHVRIHGLDGALSDALADAAWSLAEDADGPRRVLVFTHRRADAEAVRTALAKRIRAERAAGERPEVELLVGGRRVHERAIAAEWLRDHGFLAGSPAPDDHTFLVATSAGEVGVDLDADDMVADLVPWERMVQRLGRVNRRGEGRARVHLFATEWDGKGAAPRAELSRLLLLRLPELPDGTLDASPAALEALTRAHPDDIAAASTPAPLHPPLDLPTVTAWSMTSLDDHTGRPEVQPWLRGWVDEPPQTTLVWREQVPRAGTPDDALAAFFGAARPHLVETLEAPAWQVRAWLIKRVKRLRRSGVFAPGEPVLVLVGRTAITPLTLDALEPRLGSRGADRLHATLAASTVVFDARFGGLAESGLLDPAHDAPPVPVDGAALPFRVTERDDAATVADPGWHEVLRLAHRGDGDAVTAWLCVDARIGDAANENARAAGRPQLLAEHQAWTAEEMARIGARSGLAADLAHALVVAAALHDEGKRAARWQRAFSAAADGPYAKTAGPVRPHQLDGYRHELGSLAHVRTDERFKALAPDHQALVLHLVAAHHGRARPTIALTGHDDRPPSALRREGEAVARRFVALQEHWGPWGLAWLEALVRSADQRASRRNAEEC